MLPTHDPDLVALWSDAPDWQLARLALEAGEYLARRTRRPEPADEPPAGLPAPSWEAAGARVVDGWVFTTTWEPIAPLDEPRLLPLTPEVVDRRFRRTSPTAAPTSTRQLMEIACGRDQSEPPAGIALAFTNLRLLEAFWGYVHNGWLSALAGHAGESCLHRLPEIPEWGSGGRHDLEDSLRWLAAQPDLDGVHDALTGEPRGTVDTSAAMATLRIHDQTAPDRKHRVRLARLMYLYQMAPSWRDRPLIRLIAELRASDSAPRNLGI